MTNDVTLSERYITVADAANRLGVERRTVTRLINLGKIPAIRLGRAYLIEPTSLTSMLEAEEQAAREAAEQRRNARSA